MLLKDTFERDIYRPIDPVVKANELAHLENELNEFVITSETEEYLQRFFDEYNDPDSPANGSWISGFFGSGKSHLLKIMAVAMEDRPVAGKGALDYLLDKLDDSPALKASLEQVRMRHPSESILFNIVGFAPNAGRSSEGALLSAFIKAFNRHCGYFDGDQQHVAKLEYDLDREGHLEQFKARVEELCGKSWEEVRPSAPLHAPKITKAFDEACGNPAGTTDNVVRYYQQTYHPDIRMFAKRVADYIAERGKGFRLNFFVDEVGQFIAQNVNLMVDLQEVASELYNFCQGDSWIVVTSQENVEDIVGQMEASSANDFSKIQARFAVKKVLESSGAKKVIRDRLLAKKSEDVPFIEELYERYRADFEVLFDFADGAKTYKQYQDVDEFVSTYPFVPYQFEVFMTALRGLSDHNCFTGRHNSTGARSMLGVFQLVAKNICDAGANTEAGTLAPFDLMFEGLRNDLRGEVYAAISTAESQLDDKVAVRLLKALLLVKYCEDFRATPGNLRVLLYGAFTESTQELNARINDALDLLERQVYVRRNGNVYEYLTNDEKEVEKEIANTIVPETQTRALIASLFNDVCGVHKVTYKAGTFEHSYSYNLQIDGEGQGVQRCDLTVNIVTDQVDGGMFSNVVPTQPKTLSVALQGARDFLVGVRTFKQTESYTQVNGGGGEVRAAIILDKQMANGKLYTRLSEQFADLLTDAAYNAGGVDITAQVNGTAAAAFESAVCELVRRSYTNLQQIPGKITDNDVYAQCTNASMALDLPDYCAAVLARIRLTREIGQTTVAGSGSTSLTAYFTKNEYGWPDIAVRSAVARLHAANKVEVRKNGAVLETAELAEALKHSRNLDSLVVEVVEEVSAQDIANLRDSCRTFMGTSPAGSDQKSIAAELASFAGQFLEGVESSQNEARSYPFASEFAHNIEVFRECAAHAADWRWTLQEFPQKAAEFTAAKDALDKMNKFVNRSPLGARWAELRDFVHEKGAMIAELGLDGEEFDHIREVVSDPCCYMRSDIAPTHKSMSKLVSAIDEKVASLRAAASDELEAYRVSYTDNYDLDSLDEQARSRFNTLFADARSSLDEVAAPHAIKSFVEDFKRANAAELLGIVTPKTAPPEIDPDGDGGEGGNPPVVKPVRTVPVGKLAVTGYTKPSIENAEDAEAYVEALRAAILQAIAAGDIVLN